MINDEQYSKLRNINRFQNEKSFEPFNLLLDVNNDIDANSEFIFSRCFCEYESFTPLMKNGRRLYQSY